MKIIYLALTCVIIILIGCSSTYAQKRISIDEKNYEAANEYSKDNVVLNKCNSISIIADSTAKKDSINASVIQPGKGGYNIFYAELFGNGFLSSLNYERVVSKYFSIRLAMALIVSGGSSNSGSHSEFGAFPFMMVNFLLNIHGNNYFEFGAGSFVLFEAFFPDFAVGYRYCAKDGGFFFSLTFDMISVTENKMIPWGGIGVGVSFK